MEHLLAWDIGGTNIKYGVFTADGRLAEKGKFASGQGEALLPLLISQFRLINKRLPIQAISIGIPGLVKDGVVQRAVNLGLQDFQLKERLEDQLKVRVSVANDASLAALGEKRSGAGADLENFMLVTIGTGIGTGIILGNKTFEGLHGAFGELGHTIVQREGRPCACGNQGCLEMYVSIKGLLANYQEAAGEHITMEELIHSQTRAKREAVDQAAQMLGFALANATTLLDLEAVLLGGGLAELPQLVEATAHWTDHFVLPMLRPVKVIKASLGNDAALYGAYQNHMFHSQTALK